MMCYRPVCDCPVWGGWVDWCRTAERDARCGQTVTPLGWPSFPEYSAEEAKTSKTWERMFIVQTCSALELLKAGRFSHIFFQYNKSLRYTYVIRWNATLSWSRMRQLAEARDYVLLSFKYRYFSHASALIDLRRPLLTPWSFLWWMNALFWASKSQQPTFTTIIKLGRARARTFFLIIPIVFVWKKSNTLRMAWRWVIFWRMLVTEQLPVVIDFHNM